MPPAAAPRAPLSPPPKSPLVARRNLMETGAFALDESFAADDGSVAGLEQLPGDLELDFESSQVSGLLSL